MTRHRDRGVSPCPDTPEKPPRGSNAAREEGIRVMYEHLDVDEEELPAALCWCGRRSWIDPRHYCGQCVLHCTARDGLIELEKLRSVFQRQGD